MAGISSGTEIMDNLSYIFLFLSVISPLSYIKDTLKGGTKPHRVTRLVVWVASLTSIIAVYGSDNEVGRLFAIVFFVRATVLLILALRYGVGGSSRLDLLCLGLGIAGVIASVSNNGLVGIWLALLADLIGYVPAFIKTYREPKSEEPFFYLLESAAALVAIIGIGEVRRDIILPVYFVTSGLVMLALIYRPKVVKSKHLV